MPKLSCGVENCANNVEQCCSLGEIGVAGSSAQNAVETCCGNFVEKLGSATNSSITPNTQLSVKCEACECTHNQNKECCADSIDISGFGASNAVETACSSFYKG